ncbi:MAG: amino acid adenylation domain-containing protein, partial [Actinomycetota bacterium]|nr:amino acid adenylation domain-containing protein [Actinomycetota bacterium]
VPVGVVGEVHLAGTGLARGYFNRPALTASSFLPDPFADRPGERMYRTGDLARHSPDGSLEFVGRGDDQVKVRGYRIELGEIEAVLSRHPEILEVAATVHLDGAGEKQIVAYAVLEEGSETTAEALSAFCREALPRYMVPALFVPVPELPRRANGKVDRKRLPGPDGARLRTDGFSSPRSDAEHVLVGIWSELLPDARVGVTDNFFELGGHSLLATRVVARVREAFGVELTLRDFFEAPTPAGIAARLGSAPRADDTSIEPVRRDRPLPLSFAQQRLWWLDQLYPGTALYNVTLQIRLPGATDPELVAAALEDVMRRHEVLRTTFGATEGTPFQRVGPVRRTEVPVFDARTSPAAWAWAAREEEAPFDLERGPLLRACLLRVSNELALLKVTTHHIVTDGWSQGLLLEELQTLLAASGNGAVPAVPPPPIQYADYAAWQRGQLTGDLLERRLAYWSELLGTDPPRCELPTDRPRPAVPDHRGGIQSFAVPRGVSKRLEEIGAEEGATMFMTLLAGFAIFAQRVTGQDLLVLGTATANRTRPETERLIGLFVNTLALPVDVSGDPTFRHLLGRVRETTLGAYAHQDLPFEKLVEHLTPVRSLDRNPLVDVMFVLQNVVGSELAEAPIPTEGAVLPGVAKFDLTVTVTQHDDLVASWEYSRALFDDSTIGRFADGFLRVLEGVAAAPDASIAAVSLLSPDEKDRVLREWSSSGSYEEAPASFPAAFERQADLAPQAPAVVFADQTITYQDLRAQVNRLAHALRGRGAGDESRIAVCLDRSPRLVVSFLGVLAAGGAYLPLDPALPRRRLEFMVEDSGAQWILTESALADRFAAHADRLVLWDDLEREPPRPADAPPFEDVDPRRLAYVIYTSGTTGRPKGAMLEHGGLSNLALAVRTAFDPGSGDRVLQLSSPSFDASIFEIVWALGCGATLCMAPAAELLPGPALERTIEDLGVTAAIITPSALTALDPTAVPSLETVIAAAEACSQEIAGAWAGGRRLFNAYGPTEATVWTTVATLDGLSRPAIGRPVANARSYILDGGMEPVPEGIVGELHIGGVGVGRGYLGRPSRTADAFVPDPFSAEPGARLYRTGDLCRFLTDGSIDFVARRDDQVKLRGFRIELGEIAAVLEQHPTVRAAVARIVGDDVRSRRLVAYAVLDQGAMLEPEALRTWMEGRLPAYMVPA